MPPIKSFSLAIGLLFAALAAAAPPIVHYHGLALDADGAPIAGPVDVRFTIFDQSTGGNALWTELHPGIQPQDGAFQVLLGSLTDLTGAVFDEDQRWLEVEIDSVALTPRQRFASVPWALRSGCTPGDVLQCYTGDIATLGEGTCAAGQRVCESDGAWGQCSGDIGPVAEVCVDGLDNDCNGLADDGCLVCGNGIEETGEQCDDGDVIGGDGCSATCQFEVCGNGVWDVGEECDDGNLVSGDGCSATCTEEAAQIAPPDAGFNDPLDIPLDSTVSVLEFVSYPGGDTQDRVRYSVTGMNPNPVLPGGQARLVISVTCFGNGTENIEIFTLGNTFSCGQTVVDRVVTADTDTGTITITATGGTTTYVQWVLTGTATRQN